MHKRLFWAYSAQILNIGTMVILLPLIVNYLTKEEIGLWFIFMTLLALAQLLDMGFQPTIARNVSYVYSGATKLLHSGLIKNNNLEINILLLQNLLESSRIIYRKIAFYAFLLLIVGGTFYISTLLTYKEDKFVVFFSWFILTFSYIINLYYGYLSAFLYGRGDIIKANKIIVYSKIAQLIISLIMLELGFGLIGLALAMFASTIVNRILSFYYVYSDNNLKIKILKYDKKEINDLISILWHNASRFGIVMIGVFLIWRANIMISASFLGLSEAASYALAIQIFLLLNTIATVPLTITLPTLNVFRANNKNEELYKLFNKVLVLQLLIYLILGIAFLLLGDYILNLMNSSVKLPSKEILLIMIIIFFLEVNHGSCANFITTGNRIPFVYASIITGIFIVIASIILTPLIGMIGLIISQGIVQIAYNNWKWPLEVGKIFEKSYVHILKDGFSNLVKLK